MKKPSVSILSIVFSGGQRVSFGQKEKVILVGPNNSGKSQTLRELAAVIRRDAQVQPTVITSLDLDKSGTSAELRTFLQENAYRVGKVYRLGSWDLHDSHIDYWNNAYLQSGLADGFVKVIDANDRLRICEQQSSIAEDEQKSKPQHILYDSEVLMNQVSELFRQAFGSDLMFNFRGGSRIPIHVGKRPPENLTNQVGDDYVASVKQNPLLDKQGDGMKSYAGILFESIVANLDITLLDEPEAFLHPPQMRRLGATLASEVKGQMVVATHSSDILRGFLEGTKGNVRILRIRREGNKNYVAEAEPSVIKELWERPTMRYSNALEGIFHEQAIICEDDSDCRLFNAVADYLEASDRKPWLDTAYVPTGGKHAVPKVASVLRKIGVPVKAVFDLDLLSDESLTQQTVEAFGGNWNDLKPLWSRVDAAVRNGVQPKTIEEIKIEVREILDKAPQNTLPRGEVEAAMKQGKPWFKVKSFGSIAIPSGDAQKDYSSLRDGLEAIGIYLVPVGEVEHFCRDLGVHGPKFVNKLLSEVPLGDDRLDELRKFVRRLHKGAHSPL